MKDSGQALTYSQPSSLRSSDGWALPGYVAVALMTLALVLAASQGPAVLDPGNFANQIVLP